MYVRPRAMRRVAVVAACVLVVVFGVAALVLKESGNRFGTADQVGLFGIGLVLAGAALLLTRPALWADERGLRVRNFLSEREIPWDVVRAVRFPHRSPWPVLDLLDDETAHVMAVQSLDGERTVEVVDTLRDMLRGSHSKHG